MAEHICPWWLGYFLASPLRKLIQDPVSILSPYVREGMTVLDVGSAMGFFSLPLAKLVGPNGKVICVDLQEKMIASLKKRITKAGFSQRMETRVCSKDSLKIEDLADSVDFSLAFALVHEVPDQQVLFRQIGQVLKPGHCLLVAEPSGHVSREAFDRTIALATENGFETDGAVSIRRSHASLLRKK
jgi:ubiquinone/menaquinone biosynthesis C-methylase UbiE